MDTYSKKYTITNDYMDINYRLKPIAAIIFFQDCFARFMTTRNLAAFDILKYNLFWVISEFNLEFVNEQPFWSEEIEGTVWLSEVSKLKIYIDFELKDKDKIFAKGDSCWLILDILTKKPVMTDIISEKINIVSKLVLNEHKKFKLCELGEKISEISHKTNFSDIDFNNHVNNKTYINLASSSLSDDFRKNNRLKKISVKFNKESFLGDNLDCSTYIANNDKTFIHRIKNKDISACDIITHWEEFNMKNDITSYSLNVRKEK